MSLALNYSLRSAPTNSNNQSNFNFFHSSLKNATSLQQNSTLSSLQLKDKKEKIETTNTQAFKQKNKISFKDHELTCFQLINLPPPINKVTLEHLNCIQFSVLSYTVPQLVSFAKDIMDATPQRRFIGKAFNLNRLIQLISLNYNVVAYHNFSHAFSVLILLHQSYNRSAVLRKCITEKQWFYVYMAALVHDINHPGTTNAFEVKCKSKLALQAGNESVLQKMHVANFWSLLKNNSQVNFLQGYSSYESADIRKLITRLILATDVTKHFKGVENLRQINKHKIPMDGESSLLVIQQLFHACDIGNPCLDFDNYMNWSALVSYEFNEITKRQKQLDLPVTSFLKYQNLSKFYGGQIGFCNGLVLPLWRELNVTFAGLEEMRNNIVKNIKELQYTKEKL